MVLSMFLIPVTNLFAENIQTKSNDNREFDFYIRPYQGNNSTSLVYRQTSNKENPWKVNLTDSWECDSHNDGCLTTFWLEHSDGKNVSAAYNVSEKMGAQYYPAYASANKSYVRLTAENNNNNGASYRIRGYWDEETW